MKIIPIFAILLASCASPCSSDADLIAFGQKESLRFFTDPESVTFTTDSTFSNSYGDLVVKGKVSAMNALGLPVVTTYWIGATCKEGKAELKSFSLNGGTHWYAPDRQ